MSSVKRFAAVEQHLWKINTFFLGCAILIAIVALVYALKNKKEIDQLEHESGTKVVTKDHFTGSGKAVDRNGKGKDDTWAQYNSNPDLLKYLRTDPLSGDWWSNNGGNTNKVYDGSDAANKVNGGAAQSQCAPIATAEPAHPSLSSYSGGPSMLNAALANSTAYPDNTAAQSLAGKVTYSCAPDVTNAGGCDYAINPDNLMPGSWRDGVSCSDGTDPNSQWAKYHPTREKYYRYITAAGSARLSANTRSSSRKIIGLQNPLRSGTSTPLTNSVISPFNDSTLRAQAIFDATGVYPETSGC